MSEISVSGDPVLDTIFNSDGSIVRGLMEMDHIIRVALIEGRDGTSYCASCDQFVENGALFEQFEAGESDRDDRGGIKCGDCVQAGAVRDVQLAHDALAAARTRLVKVEGAIALHRARAQGLPDSETPASRIARIFPSLYREAPER